MDDISSDLSSVKFKLIKGWKGHSGTVSDILFYPEKKIVISSSYDDSVRVFDLSSIKSKEVNLSDPHRIHVYESFEGVDVNCLLRWDNKSFLCATDGGNVFHFSLEHPFNLIKKFNVIPAFDNKEDEEESTVVNVFDLAKFSPNPIGEAKRRYSSQQPLEEDSLIAFVGKRTREGVGGLIDYSKNEVIRVFPNFNLTVVSFTNIMQSFLYPDCVLLNAGKEFVRENKNDGKVHLVSYETGKIIKQYDKHKANIYSIYHFMKQNREILVIGGSGEYVYFYDVETTNLLMFFRTSNHGCSFLRLGKTHLLIGLGENKIEIIDFAGLNIENSISKSQVEVEDAIKKKKKEFCDFRLAESRTDLDCMCLYTGMEGDDDDDMIKVIVGSNDQHLYIVGISNLQVSPIDDFLEYGQMKRDMDERIEYVLYDDTRYVGDGEENPTIRILGQEEEEQNVIVVIKHELIKYFMKL